MPLQYKNTFLEFVPAVPELRRSKTSPDLLFTLETEQKHAEDRVDSDAETEYRSSESSHGDSPLPAVSQRKPLTGPLWADMTDDEEEEELCAPVVAAAAPAAPKMSWADITESDDEESAAPAEEPTSAAKAPEKPAQEDDGWTTVVAKKGKKGKR